MAWNKQQSQSPAKNGGQEIGRNHQPYAGFVSAIHSGPQKPTETTSYAGYCFLSSFKVAEHSFQVAMPNSPLLLNY